MKILGVTLRRPTVTDVTVMMAVATFLLVAVLLVAGLVGYRPGTYTKAVFLASLAWGVLSNLIGHSGRGALAPCAPKRNRLRCYLPCGGWDRDSGRTLNLGHEENYEGNGCDAALSTGRVHVLGVRRRIHIGFGDRESRAFHFAGRHHGSGPCLNKCGFRSGFAGRCSIGKYDEHFSIDRGTQDPSTV
ncbi:hypothetical protein QZM82_39120 [Burkholderia cepacia]|uniref:hypothetical protein n=1 Tax=Burkholderia cepacia TaxID=292 RepID=UPI00264D8777|nr:hypothetical protein [Burkholderia cepacia]MDN7902209.1 hypothetical protein [Burkholderia cepacia]